jgi:hypothetical protein
MEDEYHFQKDGKQRNKGKFGIQTSSSLKNNAFDHNHENGSFVRLNDEAVLYSLNKKKLWEKIEDLKIEIKTQPSEGKQIQLAAISNDNCDK